MASQFPAPDLPCTIGTTLHAVAVCLDGTAWEYGWVVHEPNLSAAKGGIVATPCGGGCAKKEAIRIAGEKGWTPTDLIAVLKALK